MKKLNLLAILIFSFTTSTSFAGAYQQGLDSGSAAMQGIINIFIKKKNFEATTGVNGNTNLNPSSNQNTNDINILKNYMNDANSVNAPASADFNRPGGRGDQKKQYCLNYTDKTKNPNPDPVKFAECKAVNELSNSPVKNYRQTSGFSKDNAVFSQNSQLNQAKSRIANTPQADLLSLVGIGGPNGTGQSCVTVNKTTPPETITGQCSRVAKPESSACSVQITPKVMLEKYCNASGTKGVISEIRASEKWSTCPPNRKRFGRNRDSCSRSFIGYGEPFYSEVSNRYEVSYRCGPPDINGEVSTIYARISPKFKILGHEDQLGGCGCPTMNTHNYDLLFTPGVSTQPVSWTSYCWDSWHGYLNGGCSTTVFTATAWYDGVEDVVKISDNNPSNYNEGGFLNSCPPGSTFVQQTNVFYPQRCSYDATTGIYTCNNSLTPQYATPSHCKPDGVNVTEVVTPVVTTKTGMWVNSGNYDIGYWWELRCPQGYIPGNYAEFQGNTCFKADYACPAISGDTWTMIVPPVTGFTASHEPIFNNAYCTRNSAINAIRKYASAPRYDGGAGVRAKLVEDIIDTCAKYQEQSPAGPDGPGGSYNPVTKNVDTCPSGYELVTAFGNTQAYCRMQPPSQPAIASVNYSCPEGGTLNQSNNVCEIQPLDYPAISSRKYTCPTGDSITSGKCPNNGVKNGESCEYPPYKATLVSQSCPSGTNLVGNLCYTDLNLAATTNTPNGTTIIESNKTYSCNPGDTLNGTHCEVAPQTVTCDHQPPSVPSYGIDHYSCPNGRTGNYDIFYSITDNTVKLNSCVPSPITKAASPNGRWCDAPYQYNAVTDKCEYQMPDYPSLLNEDCSANPGYIYDATAIDSKKCYFTPPAYDAF